jgi:hypothetical protein
LLQVPLPDVVSMQTRQANLEGAGEIALRRLVKEALRMRPSRIIVGEVRQEEYLDLLIALDSGLPVSVHHGHPVRAVRLRRRRHIRYRAPQHLSGAPETAPPARRDQSTSARHDARGSRAGRREPCPLRGGAVV